MNSMITARVDAEKRKEAEKVFSEVGLTTSAAINLFICAVAREKGIPFAIGLRRTSTTPVAPTKQGNGLRLGLADGKYDFPADFDQKFDSMDAEVAELFQ